MINVIFDIDGVLIDVRRSLHDTIKTTVTYYLKNCLNVEVSRYAVTEDDIQLFKSLGGFNDDWDLTAGMLYYFVSLLPKTNFKLKGTGLLAIQSGLRLQVKEKESLIAKSDISTFIKRVRGIGLEGVLKATGGRNKELVFFSGDLYKNDLVKRIFQEVYWGVDIFPKLYNTENLFYFKTARIHKEILIADESVLKTLANRKDVMLSIATGREKVDAEYTLEKYGINKYFSHVFTLSDIKDKGMKKPHPYSLLKLEEKINKPFEKRYYIGDQCDDIMMANRAKEHFNIVSIGYVYNSRDIDKKKFLKDCKADHVVDSFREILNIVS